jgi:hypothetical protein
MVTSCTRLGRFGAEVRRYPSTPRASDGKDRMASSTLLFTYSNQSRNSTSFSPCFWIIIPVYLSRWDKTKTSIRSAAKAHPWEKKLSRGFFRGSRTSDERDSLVLLSRSKPELLDAEYTKNQAWKSPKVNTPKSFLKCWILKYV